MSVKKITHSWMGKSLLAAALCGPLSIAWAVDLEFYFPVAVGGKAADTIQELTDDCLLYTSPSPRDRG